MELMAVAQQTPLSITNVVVKTPFHCQFCIKKNRKVGKIHHSHIALFHIIRHNPKKELMSIVLAYWQFEMWR
jgi:hypothetical protein